MSHHFSQDKAVKKPGMPEISLLMLFLGQVLFKSMKANFHPEHLPYKKKYLEKIPKINW